MNKKQWILFGSPSYITKKADDTARYN